MKTVRLNPADFLFLAMEDVVTSQGQVICMRFNRELTPERMRSGLRAMVGRYPRLRSVIVPTLASWRMRILDDGDPHTEVLFNDAFRVVDGVRHETAAWRRVRRDLLNEPFSLEQGLPFKARYLSEAHTLFLSIHHSTCDGMAYVHLTDDLMAWLNDRPLSPRSPDDPGLWPAFHDGALHRVPAALLRSVRALRREFAGSIKGPWLEVSDHPSRSFGPVDMHTHTLDLELDHMLLAARAQGVSLTTLVVAALIRAADRVAPAADRNPVGVIFPFDLRPYFPEPRPVFGNYVGDCMIGVSREDVGRPERLLQTVGRQLGLPRKLLERRELIATIIIDSLPPLLGRKLLARVIRLAKRRGLIARTLTCSTLGRLDHLNRHGELRLDEFVSNINSHGLFIVYVTMHNRLTVSYSYQEGEFAREDVVRFADVFAGEMDRLSAREASQPDMDGLFGEAAAPRGRDARPAPA